MDSLGSNKPEVFSVIFGAHDFGHLKHYFKRLASDLQTILCCDKILLVNRILSILQDKRFKIILHVLLVPCLIVAGFYVGKGSLSVSRDEKNTKIQEDCNLQVKELKNELEATINDRAQLLNSTKEVYQREKFAIYSPLLEGKEVEVFNFKYKTKNIVQKRIRINDFSGIEIWEYESSYSTTAEPENFATFGGYENYAYKATSIEEIKKGWDESYKTKGGIEVFYDYEYVQKSIGVVSLSSYISFFPNFKESKPSLVRIWNSKLDGFPTSKNDSSVLRAKLELNKIADTLVFAGQEE